MFVIHTNPAEYVAPWNKSFEDRWASLQRADFKIVYLYGQPDSSTFRYRVYNMIQALGAGDSPVAATYFFANEIDRLLSTRLVADVLVLARIYYSDKVNRLATRFRNAGKRVFFDCDDLVFDLRYVHLIVDTLDQDLNHPQVWDSWFGWCGRLAGTMILATDMIVTNHFLKNRAAGVFGGKIHVIPNFLNFEQLAFSAQLLKEKRNSEFARTENFLIGYFSGTPSHNKDLAIVTPALEEILAEHPNATLRIVGHIELKGNLSKYRDQIEFYPLHDFVNLQRQIAFVDLNIVPLQDNIFTNCKSELKFFEASVVGTVTVASPTYTYQNAIEDGRDGLLCPSIEWREQIICVIEMKKGEYIEMANRAADKCISRYSPERWTKVIRDVLGCPEEHTALERTGAAVFSLHPS